MRAALAALLCLLAVACANDPTTRVCATGILCPASMQCAAGQPECRTNSCGNGMVDPGEQCDYGNIPDGDRCSSQCRAEVCGNHSLDMGEVCDDGNTLNGDGCSADCKSTEVCGN